MSSTSADQLAELLRHTADRLDAAGDLGGFNGLRLYLSISADSYSSTAPEHERVAVVHALATALRLPTGDRVSVGSSWEYVAKRSDGPAVLRVDTDITAPPHRCACGQTCTHGATGTTRAA